jgi:hypothetical protein
MMAEPENKDEQKALKRAQVPKLPSDLRNDGTIPGETPADDAGFQRPKRVEHTSEKEHPPGKE